MREIVLDTETTGLSPRDGDRLVEIGCLELMNHMPTGETYHQYVNPRIPMPTAAEAIHGLSDKFLSDKTVFMDKNGHHARKSNLFINISRHFSSKIR